VFYRPETWGINDAISLEQPLSVNTPNYICAGKQPLSKSKVITLYAGKTYSFRTICGELNVNAPGCLNGDWHTGDSATDFSGCVLAAAYSNYKNPSNHKLISYSSTCPKKYGMNNFKIGKKIQNCEGCVCSWAWAPSIDYSTPQFYHNCFYCNIRGGIGTSSKMKTLPFINVPNAKYQSTTFNKLFKKT
jgi:hypothetical protein